jgi:hypothetical protein
MRYEGKLSHSLLSPTDLSDLESVMLEGLTDPTQKITIVYAGFSKSYPDVQELLSDPLRPDIAHEFTWDVETTRESFELWSTLGRLQASGNESIVREKVSKLNSFFRKRRSIPLVLLRTFGFWLILIFLGMFVLGVGAPDSSASPPSPANPELLLIGGLFVTFGIVATVVSHYFGGIDHRTSLVLRENKRFYWVETGLALFVGVVATVIGSLLLRWF